MLPCCSQCPPVGQSQMKILSPSSKTDLTFLIQEKCFSTFMYQYAQIKEADEMIKTQAFISNGQNGEMGFWTG